MVFQRIFRVDALVVGEASIEVTDAAGLDRLLFALAAELFGVLPDVFGGGLSEFMIVSEVVASHNDGLDGAAGKRDQ